MINRDKDKTINLGSNNLLDRIIKEEKKQLKLVSYLLKMQTKIVSALMVRYWWD